MEKRFRRYQNMLVTCGRGMILLGIMPVLQAFIYFFLMPERLDELVGAYDYMGILRTVIIVMFLVLLGIELLFRILAGRAAIKEGKGKKKSAADIILGAIVLAITLFEVIAYIRSMEELEVLNGLMYLVFYFFSLYVNVQMLVAAIAVKVTDKKLQQKAGIFQGEAHAG